MTCESKIGTVFGISSQKLVRNLFHSAHMMQDGIWMSFWMHLNDEPDECGSISSFRAADRQRTDWGIKGLEAWK